MDYPKPVMNLSQLAEMGFSKSTLRSLIREPGQKIAVKTPGGGKWLVDTAALDRRLAEQRDTRRQKRSRKAAAPPATCRGILKTFSQS